MRMLYMGKSIDTRKGGNVRRQVSLEFSDREETEYKIKKIYEIPEAGIELTPMQKKNVKVVEVEKSVVIKTTKDKPGEELTQKTEITIHHTRPETQTSSDARILKLPQEIGGSETVTITRKTDNADEIEKSVDEILQGKAGKEEPPAQGFHFFVGCVPKKN